MNSADLSSRILAVTCAAWLSAAVHPSAAGQASPSSPIDVLPTAHLQWDQFTGSVDGLQFVVVVDDVPSVLSSVTCRHLFIVSTCTAPLPTLAPGVIHRLEVLYHNAAGAWSEHSAPIYVRVAAPSPTPTSASTPTTMALSSQLAATSSAPGRRGFDIAILASALNAPSAISPTPDGRVLIADRSGAVLVWSGGQLVSGPAAVLADVATSSDVGLVDLALHPRFAENSLVFAAYTAKESDGSFTNRIVRFREVANTLGDAAVLLTDRVTEPPRRTPRLRFGADEKLYALFPVGTDASITRDAASYAGKLLRLNPDGTTPRDNPTATPIYIDRRVPVVSFDWQPATRALWLITNDNGRVSLQAVGSTSRFDFDASVDAAGMTFYTGNAIPSFAGQLFIASGKRGGVERVAFDPADPRRVSATDLLAQEYGRVTQVVTTTDGALYFATSNTPLLGAPSDVVARIVGPTSP